jgi:DNA-binding response OmpR family regulator
MAPIHNHQTRILLADDDDGLRLGLATALRERGFDALEADCGSRALEIATADPPDVSLLDLNMPDMTGVEVLRRMIALGIRVPCLVMTAEAEPRLRVEAVQLGARAVLSKPFGFADLMGLLREILRQDR